MSRNHYVYYSYEEWGRGYIGVRSTKLDPLEDKYMGSFKDRSFKPTRKEVIAVFSSREEALNAEIILHNFYLVDINLHFANKRKQTSKKFDREGRRNPMEGKSHTIESKKLISRKLKEVAKNPNHIKKLSNSQKGLTWWNNGFVQTKSRLSPGGGFVKGQLFSSSEVKRGKNNPMWGKTGKLATCFGRVGEKHPLFGKKHSAETKEKMSLAHGRGENSLAYGKKWWNNGKIRKFSKECPDDGFKLGYKLSL